jgi:beta-glucanase (GH16 family)
MKVRSHRSWLINIVRNHSAIFMLLAPSAAAASTIVPGRVEAENYDVGGEGVGYATGHPAWGTAFPRSDSMDIGYDASASNGYYIGWVAPKQWFAYTLSVKSAGSYKLAFLVTTPWSSSLRATIDDVDVTGALALPQLKGGFYHSVTSKALHLGSGTHKLVVHFEGSSMSLDAIDVIGDSLPAQSVVLHDHTYSYNSEMSDEFNGSSLDTSKWQSTYKGGVKRLNDEWECYSDQGTRAMTGSSLKLSGIKTGAAHAQSTCASPNYQSGLIRSTAQQKFGYFEAALKLPGGAGMWPAFWLIAGPNAANQFAPLWPPEIDVLEMVNNGREGPFQVTQFVHGCGKEADSSLLNSWGDYPSSRGALNFADSSYHLFAVEWTPSSLFMYVDGSLARSYDFNWDMSPPAGETGLSDPSGCSRHEGGPAELILNLAMGGGWPGEIDDSVLPQALEIDYVRAYRY